MAFNGGYMTELEKIEILINTSNRIKTTLDEYNLKIKKTTCDKYGKGFNLDDRFSAVSFNLSLDSWTGYYGHSGCSTEISIGNKEKFIEHFIKILNKKFDELLLLTADSILSEAILLKEKAISELKEKTKKIENLGIT